MLEKQIREFHPRLVAVWKEEAARDLAVRVQDLDVKIVSQMGGLIELARMEESDILVTAIVGMIGIRPTMEAILAGKDIALANKETLVTAGHLFTRVAESTVIFCPITQFGCFSVSSRVTFSRSAVFFPRKGPPDAVMSSLCICSLFSP